MESVEDAPPAAHHTASTGFILNNVPRVPVPSLDLSRKDVLMTLTECEETAEDGDELQPASASSVQLPPQSKPMAPPARQAWLHLPTFTPLSARSSGRSEPPVTDESSLGLSEDDTCANLDLFNRWYSRDEKMTAQDLRKMRGRLAKHRQRRRLFTVKGGRPSVAPGHSSDSGYEAGYETDGESGLSEWESSPRCHEKRKLASLISHFQQSCGLDPADPVPRKYPRSSPPVNLATEAQVPPPTAAGGGIAARPGVAAERAVSVEAAPDVHMSVSWRT